MANTSYLSPVAATAAVALNEVAEDVEDRAKGQANRSLYSPNYSAGKRTMNLLKAMRVTNAATAVLSAFASGFHAGMLLQMQALGVEDETSG